MAPKTFMDEMLRKGLHLASVAIVLVYFFFGKTIVLYFMTSYLVLVLIIEHLRLDRGYRLPVIHYLLRKEEETSLAGHIYFTLGAIVAVSVYSENIAYAALLMATFGDMSAALIGKSFGKRRIFRNGKSFEGCVAEFTVDLVIGYALLSNPEIAFIMALVATAVETGFEKIDDNLAIPVFSGFAGELMVMLTAYMKL
ncbi:diacylglycerol/polyprenol kinase family protein [Methanolobus vulcani]|uniref:CTP--2, 3-di-O-geranylgeranyl-sn-glycero-1-phosphate cytidyltransferase n=1 Tax=Methanolobus vulcani TaxID=38026 RepID=A0A7Z8P1C9_9EURY|nr:CTP--2,3-di-O-geranylgeranyl-sn-glycero-1-phosphate cytidyltransferase [Methanolobus vulcani]TQD24018.1 CTP--2,3-di-O-geranylgeranyl-sn-glycero-1-phosphate cytidyltransferase [Methanolobus vulcani]